MKKSQLIETNRNKSKNFNTSSIKKPLERQSSNSLTKESMKINLWSKQLTVNGSFSKNQ